MPQFIALVLIIVLVKLLYDYFKSVPAKGKQAPQGDFIDISEKWINADQMPYKKNDYPLPNRELMIFRAFQELFRDGLYTVFPHVPLTDLLLVPAGAENRQEYLHRIRERNVDMVVYEMEELKPVLIINLRSADSNKRQQISDQFTENALKTAGYRSIAVDLNELPGQEELVWKLRAAGLQL
ncbi:MAG: DUF2726 domain-containing protein [Syntrophomonadaceae bacterium]